MRWLKKIRVIIAIFFIAISSLPFLDIHGKLTFSFFDYIFFLQFIPSIMQFIIIPCLATSGFLFVLLFTLIFGRIYCSFVCPLGILIDIFSFIKKKIRKRKNFNYSAAYNLLRYSVLFAALLSAISGSLIFIKLLDPFSNFGRIMNMLARPVAIAINNLSAATLELVNRFDVSPYQISGYNFAVLLFTITFLGILLFLTLKHGRLFCNTLCPAGTLLGVFSKLSFIKIRLNDEKCVSCKACEKICKSECISGYSKNVDFSRCVCCFNCIDKCPTDAISYNFIKSGYKTGSATDQTRRNLILSIIFILAGLPKALFGNETIKVYIKNKIPVLKKHLTTPPGSKSISHFKSLCTACYTCVAACPSQILQPSLFDYGSDGILMPHMDNNSGFCNYECVKCSQVCPTGAILTLTPDEKKLTQIGRVAFIKDNCIVITQKTACGACAEHCPTKAVIMAGEGKLKLPKTNVETCVGCGACEYACPAIPFKAIYVEGNPVHKKATPPKKEKPQVYNPDADFPF